MAAVAPQRARPSTASNAKRPTTPLRRISRGSLSALSASRSREDDEHPLEHLAGVFAELSEALEDLAVNFEAMDAINEDLDNFNEGFGGFLYGLRMNAYVSEFPEKPRAINFQHADERAAIAVEQAEADRRAQDEAASRHRSPSPTPSTSGQTYTDATFVTMAGDDDIVPVKVKGKGLPSGKTRAGLTKTAAAKKKEALINFAKPIIATLPIQFREQQPQRADAETVIRALRQNVDGLRVPELVKMLSLIPQHRINDCLQALVRAKHALKESTKAGAVYRLDPLKYPAA